MEGRSHYSSKGQKKVNCCIYFIKGQEVQTLEAKYKVNENSKFLHFAMFKFPAFWKTGIAPRKPGIVPWKTGIMAKTRNGILKLALKMK